MVLLHLLHRLARQERWRLAVAHFNHLLRGPASHADERLVKRTAAKLKVPCAIERGDVRAFARNSRLSIEMAARQLRHAFLARVARARGFRTIALAHHADDQVELFFLRVLRGTGVAGLGGMNWSSPSPADPRLRLVRPLLGFSKEELADYARAEKVRYREDVSNESLDVPRNRIRHDLLPRLTRFHQPSLAQTTLRLMEILRAESDCLADQANRWLEAAPAHRPGFDQLPVALQRRILQQQLQRLGAEMGFEGIEHLRLRPSHPLSVSPSSRLTRDSTGQVRLDMPDSLDFHPQERALDLRREKGPISFGGVRIGWRLETGAPIRPPSPRKVWEVFDASKVGPDILLRHWRPGDKFQPIGLASAVKLQDLFTNLKIPPAARRRRIVAVTRAGNIFWVEGLRISELGLPEGPGIRGGRPHGTTRTAISS